MLLKAYDSEVAEYRFNVQITWDRTKFFILLNSALVAAGIGLMKFADSSFLVAVFLVLFFILAISIAFFGLFITEVGKRYYREAVYTKTLLERELGLLEPVKNTMGLHESRRNLSIAVTRGQRNFEDVLYGKYVSDVLGSPIAPGTIAAQSRSVFWAMIIIEGLGACMSLYLAVEQLPKVGAS